MTCREAAQNVAVALGGLELQGKNLTVNIVEDRPVAPASAYQKFERGAVPEKRKRPRLGR
jgi:hypothetical protein